MNFPPKVLFMKKALLIAEKPSYMREIKAVYEKHKSEIPFNIDFIAQRGHLVQLLDPAEMNEIYKSWDINYLPIVPEDEGGWKYKIIPGAENLMKEIKKKLHSGEYDLVIHAGDPDQEGELLVRLVLDKLKNTLPVIRLWVNATTESEILAGLKNMKSDDEAMYENLYYSALVRQHSDWRFGMNGSRAVANKIVTSKDNKIAVGRVMTAILSIVVKREDDIKNFKPQTTYGIVLNHSIGLEAQLFQEEVTTDEKGKKNISRNLVYFDTKKEAEDLIDKLDEKSIVLSVEEKNEKVYAPKLYNLSDLQYDASKLNFSPDETLEIVQGLYEKHFLTYPRTDCNYLNSTDKFEEMIHAAASVPGYEIIAKKVIGNIESVKKNKKFVNNEELKKHGHSALCPTDVPADFERLSTDEQLIYKLVCRRYLSIFLPPMIQKKTIVVVENNDNLFRTIGKRIIDKGYTTFLNAEIKNIDLPEVKKGEMLEVDKKNIVEKTSTCPKRFTSGDLARALENPAKFLQDKNIVNKDFKIGTSATRAEIIKKLIKDKYLSSNSKQVLSPTEWGSFLAHALKDLDISKADMTAKWEDLLQRIKKGELPVEQAEDMMRREVKKLIYDISNMQEYTFGDVNANTRIVGKCPYCGKDIINSGKNYFCSGYKEGCNTSMPLEFLGAKFSSDDAMALFKGAVITKKLKKDKSIWQQDLRFNKETGRIEFVKNDAETDIPCPKCGRKLKHDGAILKCECGYSLWTKVAGYELSDDELGYIFEHGTTHKPIKKFKSSKGKAFSANLKLKKDYSGFEFVFEK